MKRGDALLRAAARCAGLRGFPPRVAVGIVLIVLFGIVSAARWARTAVASAAAGADEVTLYEARIQVLRGALPAVEVVGYLTDAAPVDLPLVESRERMRHYVLTQYSLAPVLVARDATPEFYVGNFRTPAGADTAAALGLVTVRDFGDGLMLFRKPTP